jgi:SAM-dependent methyltransferase
MSDKYNRVLKIDVDREPLGIHSSFDAIVFGDILEHTEDPQAVINKFLPVLKPNGIMVISVPNFANWFVRLNILFGNFNYAESGILDKYHLKFFTLKSAREMLNKSGLLIERVKATPIPLPLMIKATDFGKPLFFLHVLNYAITKTRKTFFGYQFIFKCRKK